MPVLASLLFGAALMQEKSNLSAAYDACLARARGITVEVRACTSQEHRRQDSRLNATYRELMRRLPESRRAGLRDAQRAWIAFREAECDYRGEQEGGGTLQAVIIDSCWLSFTAERADQLQHALEFEREYGD